MSGLRRTGLVTLCSLLAAGTTLAGDPLAKVNNIHIKYQSNAKMDACKGYLANALSAQGLGISSNSAQSDAILEIKLDVTPGKLRSSINWSAVLFDHHGMRLYSSYGEESGWTAQAACKDLADDLGEDIKDDIRNARILGF